MSNKKLIKNELLNVEVLEDVDSKYYGLYVTDKTKKFAEWRFEPTAFIISLEGFENFKLFMTKDTKNKKWKISESYCGTFLYSSPKSETKANAIKNCLTLLKKYKITKEELNKKIIDKINNVGLSPKYRK